MTAELSHWLVSLWATDVPLLPGTNAMDWWLSLGWGLVLAALSVKAVARWSSHRTLLAGAAGFVFAWAWIPGQFSATHWLGLAFQMPSISLVLLAAVVVVQQLLRDPHSSVWQPGAPLTRHHRARLALAVIGMVAGWVLLLDTLALLPLQVYAWGFSPAAVGLALGMLLLPWIMLRPEQSDRLIWLGPLACLLFVALRLPTGNVWDALLDPWLWLALQIYLVREFLRYVRRKGV